MPTINQLPPASATSNQDEIPVSQGGVTRSVTVSELLAGTQPVIALPNGSMLGRLSLGPGGPEPVPLGVGLNLAAAALSADGTDHAHFAQRSALTLSDDVIVNAGGTPMRLAAPLLRGLFTAGANVAIGGNGAISSITDPGVSTSIATLNTGLATTNANVATLSAKIPTGGYVALNALGQMTQPVAADVTLGTIAAPGSTAPPRTMGMRVADTLNLRDYGAVAGGGDCTAAFNAAFAALPSNGGEIYIPTGDYIIQTPLVFTGKSIRILGDGKGLTRLHFQHTGIAFDFVPVNGFNKVLLRDFTAVAEANAGPTAAVARITYAGNGTSGYQQVHISNVECFGYPNPQNGVAPFPQTFNRGFILVGCGLTQIVDVSFFGPPAVAGTTTSCAVEINQSIDTRVHGLQMYGGHAAVIQTGYCEGVYLVNPLVVASDYVIAQTNQTGWPGYAAAKPMLLGVWIVSGELNTNLGVCQLANVLGSWILGCDVTRDGGPSTPQVLFDLTNCSSMHIIGCSILGGAASANQDIAFRFQSTWNSSGCVIGGCHVEDLATVIDVPTGNGTVNLTTFGLNLLNVPMATAFIDNSLSSVGNQIQFTAPVVGSFGAGSGNTKDHLFSGKTGQPLAVINNVVNAANLLRLQAAASGAAPALCFDGTDATVGGVIQTKGGGLAINAGGGSGGATMLTLANLSGATAWIQMQNASAANACALSTSAGGLTIQPAGQLSLSPSGGMFAPGLPTVKPAAGSNQIWNNGGNLAIA